MSGWTLGFQVINFLILAAVLYRFLFKPVSRIVAQRQEQVVALSREAELAKRSAEETRERYERELAGLSTERQRVLTAAQELAAEDCEHALQKAATDAAALLASGRATLEQERNDAERRLSDQAVLLAVDIAKRLLAEAADGSTAELFLGRLFRHLETLPRERVTALRAELSGGKALVVAVAPPLAEGARAHWTELIARLFDGSHAVQIVDDSELVAGAELRLPHATLSFSWRDALERARKECSPNADAH